MVMGTAAAAAAARLSLSEQTNLKSFEIYVTEGLKI